MVTGAGNRSVVCATDDSAARIEDLQLTLGEGPCIDAVRDRTPVLISDLMEPDDVRVQRWPAFMEGVGKLRVSAVFAFPLCIGATSFGALDLYRERPGALDAAQLSAALLAADAAALALLYLDFGRDDAFSERRGDHSSYQLQVHQATGMVQVQLGITTKDAFVILRARAFASRRPLVDVATDVVERRLRFSAEDQ